MVAFIGFLWTFMLLALVAAALAITVLVLSVVVTVEAYKAGREGWWIYLIAIFLSPLNLIAVIAWYAHLRKNPILSDGKPFL